MSNSKGKENFIDCLQSKPDYLGQKKKMTKPQKSEATVGDLVILCAERTIFQITSTQNKRSVNPTKSARKTGKSMLGLPSDNMASISDTAFLTSEKITKLLALWLFFVDPRDPPDQECLILIHLISSEVNPSG